VTLTQLNIFHCNKIGGFGRPTTGRGGCFGSLGDCLVSGHAWRGAPFLLIAAHRVFICGRSMAVATMWGINQCGETIEMLKFLRFFEILFRFASEWQMEVRTEPVMYLFDYNFIGIKHTSPEVSLWWGSGR
jgi:hypothetical protein